MDDHPPPTGRQRWTRTGALVLLVGLALAGCSGSDSDRESTSDGSDAAPAAAPAQEDAETQAAAPEQDTARTQLGIRNRALVYTGELQITAKDPTATSSQAIQVTLAAGGWVAGDTREGGPDHPEATLTLRVPSNRFTSTVDALARLGTEESRRLGTEDLQTTTIDVDARIASQRASVNRVRALLARATSISELTAIERELTTREAELASTEASRRTTNDRVAYSTITVRVGAPSPPPKPEPKTERGLWVGLRNGWSALVATVTVGLTVLGWLAPFVAGIALIGGPIWWAVLRSRRHRPQAPAAPNPAETAPAEPGA